jgi:hypothetical protein
MASKPVMSRSTLLKELKSITCSSGLVKYMPMPAHQTALLMIIAGSEHLGKHIH